MILISDINWDPTILDYPAEDNEEWFNAQTSIKEGINSPLIDEFENYKNRTCIGEYEFYFFDTNSYLKAMQMILS